MNNRSFIALVLSLSLLATSSYAVHVDLFDAEVPVDSQTADARTDAARIAFEQVLLKLTGDSESLKNPVINESLKKAGYFVQEYRYELPSANAAEYIIHIRFDHNDMSRLLKRAGITYWGEKRPLILVFLALQKSNGEAEVIGDDQLTDIGLSLKAYSRRYGLPMILPAMDMEDLNQFSAEDVVGMLLPNLKTAAKRYAPEAYLIGTIQQTFGGYNSQWQLLMVSANKQWNWSFSDHKTDQIIANVVEQATEALSNRPHVKKTNPSDVWVRLEVTNIFARDELTQLMEFLRAISIVRDVQLSQVSHDSVKVAVLINGTVDAFQQSAAISGSHLELKAEHKDANILLYQWTR